MRSLQPLTNECYGFMGTLYCYDYTEKQVNDLYSKIAKEMIKNWGLKDKTQIRLVFDSKFGRWMADSIIGCNKSPSEIIVDVFRTQKKFTELTSLVSE